MRRKKITIKSDRKNIYKIHNCISGVSWKVLFLFCLRLEATKDYSHGNNEEHQSF